MGSKSIGLGIGVIVLMVMLTACGRAHHDAAGVHPASPTTTRLSPKQLCLTIFRNITGTKLPSSSHGQFNVMLKEAKEIQNLAGQTSDSEIARDFRNLAEAYKNDARAFYGNAGSKMRNAVALQKATGTVITALECAKVGN